MEVNANIVEKIDLVFNQNGISVDDDTKNIDLEFDSITLISIMVGLENEFELSFDDNVLLEFPRTYTDWLNLVSRALSSDECDRSNL